MCNRYNIKGTHRDVAEFFEFSETGLEFQPGDIFPGGISLGVLIDEEGKRFAESMQFGLAKSKSAATSFDRKRPLNNTRVENVESRTWASSFRERRCIVPLSAMHESCWWGKAAGQKVYFSAKDADYLGVASIYRIWSSPIGEPLYTMSFLMRPADSFIMEHGHHRQPFFISRDGYDEWLQPGERSPEQSKQVLREFALEPDWSFEVESELKSYSKNAKAREKKREEQLDEIANSGKPLGI